MKSIYFIVVLVAFLMGGCAQKKAMMSVGGEKDSHGCLPAAGYQWSEVRKDCIRIFEDGIQLVSATDKNSSFAAYAVFSPDSSLVEMFIPGVDKNPVLRKQGTAGYWSENPKFMGAYNFANENGVWVLSQANRDLYKSAK